MARARALVAQLPARAGQRHLHRDELGAGAEAGKGGGSRAPSSPGLRTGHLTAGRLPNLCPSPAQPRNPPLPRERAELRAARALRALAEPPEPARAATPPGLGVRGGPQLPGPLRGASPPSIATLAPKDEPMRSLGRRGRPITALLAPGPGGRSASSGARLSPERRRRHRRAPGPGCRHGGPGQTSGSCGTRLPPAACGAGGGEARALTRRIPPLRLRSPRGRALQKLARTQGEHSSSRPLSRCEPFESAPQREKGPDGGSGEASL